MGTKDDKQRSLLAGTVDSLLREIARADPVAPQENLLGATLAHYRVEAKLGQGGMGVVYRARDARLGRDVAVKVLRASVAADGEHRARLLREARSAAAANHPNIAAVYDVGESEGRVYLAMELVDGVTLRERLAAGALPAAEAVFIARSIAAGLSRAHEKGIVHRDLKPENVMLGRDGTVKILDFGLAKLHEPDSTDSALANQETQTLEGRAMGTPGYMSPEQASGRPVDARTDVYALGVVLHEMLTGGLPGIGSGRNAVAHPQLEAIVARCMAAAPDDRWPDAGRLLAALEALGDVAPAKAKTRRALPWLLAMALAALASSAVVVTRSTHLRAPPAASAGAAPSVTTILDLPPPRTAVPEALAEYRAGLQLVRDDSWEQAESHLLRAAQLDPSMVEAHLRAGLFSAAQPPGDRDELGKAVALRTQLSERDQVMLDAVEPVMGRSVPDTQEGIRRLKAASERYPGDVEFLLVLGVVLQAHGLPEQAAAVGRRLAALDPLDANAWELISNAAYAQGDLEAARIAAERCAATSAESSDGLGHLLMIEGTLGHCERMEAVGSRQADVAPIWGSSCLLAAMRATGRPESARRTVFDRQLAHEPSDKRPFVEGLYETSLAIEHGRFDRALDTLDALAKAIDANDALRTEARYRKTLLTTRLRVLLETGDMTRARAVAAEIVDAFESTNPDESLGLYIVLAGRQIEPARTAWVHDALDRGDSGPTVWLAAWARPARTPEDARAALTAIEHEPRLALPQRTLARWSVTETEPGSDAVTGHVLLLAGRAADALVYLRRQVANCFDRASDFEFAHSHVDLGGALEQTGDTKGACDAYREVLARWEHAKPRSVSAEAAREGVKRLHCGP